MYIKFSSAFCESAEFETKKICIMAKKNGARFSIRVCSIKMQQKLRFANNQIARVTVAGKPEM